MEPSRSLQLSEQLAFQRRVWAFQRVGWLAMGALVVAALLGLFGQGVLSQRELSADGVLSARYDRIARETAPTLLQVEIGPTAVRDNGVELSIDRAYLERMQLERVMPEPREVVALPGALLFRFDTVHSGQPVALQFHFKPMHAGAQTAQLKLSDGTGLRLPQFVFP